VHVDEKWFFILKNVQGVCLHPLRTLPTPQAQNKHYVTKVMFLAAVIHPRKLFNRVWFDGQIRIWPIVDTKVAQYSAKHHPKGIKVIVPATVDGEREV
ncbi:unnamed protein product, partial [Choristocarpus tenellus]